METKFNYESAQEALAELNAKGYTVDFNIDFDRLGADAENYTVDYLYRYEGDSNPDDESSVYGISHIHHGEKGVFVAGNLSFLEGKKRDIILNLELKSKS